VRVADATPAGSSVPTFHVTVEVPVEVETVPIDGVADASERPEGHSSVTTTPVDGFGPDAVTVTVYFTVLDGEVEATFAIFATERSAMIAPGVQPLVQDGVDATVTVTLEDALMPGFVELGDAPTNAMFVIVAPTVSVAFTSAEIMRLVLAPGDMSLMFHTTSEEDAS